MKAGRSDDAEEITDAQRFFSKVSTWRRGLPVARE